MHYLVCENAKRRRKIAPFGTTESNSDFHFEGRRGVVKTRNTSEAIACEYFKLLRLNHRWSLLRITSVFGGWIPLRMSHLERWTFDSRAIPSHTLCINTSSIALSVVAPSPHSIFPTLSFPSSFYLFSSLTLLSHFLSLSLTPSPSSPPNLTS